jgi:putative ABC transport system permease protein
VVSESLARANWPDRDPIGRHVQFGGIDGDPRVFTVVGVVADIRERGREQDPLPTFYASYRQRPAQTGRFTLVLHTAGDPTALIAPVRTTLRALDPQAAPRFRTIAEHLATTLTNRRFTLVVIGVFSLTSLLLAVLGIYGVLAYSVSQRTREFGVRMALGAGRRDVHGLVLRQAGRLLVWGVVVGTTAAWGVTGVMRSMLFGITPTDPIAFGGVIAVLSMTALAASQLPSLRASRVDPATALRHE